MEHFRQAFIKYGNPPKPGSDLYLLNKAVGLLLLYTFMLNAVKVALPGGVVNEAFTEAQEACAELMDVGQIVGEKFYGRGGWFEPADVDQLNMAIKMARDAVIRLPKLDEVGGRGREAVCR